jgi:nucleotide-binding universal stress UspA family protein
MMIRRILAALDGSERAPGVLAAAAAVAARFDAVLIPFRAVTLPPEFPPMAHVSHRDMLPDTLDEIARRELSILCASLTVRNEPPVVRHGEPAAAILAAAEAHDVDLVVIGSHGYRRLERLLGTTAASVVNLSQRSVLVIHERRPASDSGPAGTQRP